MQIGIMTFWESQDNYGQILQGFALQKYLKERGHDAYTIRFKRIPVIPKKTLWERICHFNLSQFIERRKTRYLLSKQPTSRGFDEFKSAYMTYSQEVYTSLEELKSSPPAADVYMTGSDQVWNNTFSVSCEPFLLGFGSPHVQRIAYAASFGVSQLNKSTQTLFKEHLPQFTKIGVREQEGVQLCHDLGYQGVTWTPDPTLLFSKSDWVQVLDLPKPTPSKKKQIFIYTLANSPIQDKDQFLKYLRSLPDVDVQYATANNDPSGNYFPNVKEWIQSIRTADFIMTNSFHGMVFCIIFNKKFVVLPNTGKAKGMNGRVLSLLEKLGLQHRLMWNFQEDEIVNLMHKQEDWERCENVISTWSQQAVKEVFSTLG